MHFTTRPARLDDVPAIHELITAAEIGWHGQPEAGGNRVVADLRRPLIDLALDTVIVEADGVPAAWAWVHGGRRAQVDVHPAYRGLGLGTRLIEWVEKRSRELGSESITQTVDDADTGGVAIVQSRGYGVLATNWLLERPLKEPSDFVAPAGIELAGYDPDRAPEVHQVVEDAFAQFGLRRKPYEEWAELTIARDSFLPEASTLAYDGAELVGVLIALDGDEGYVEQLAVGTAHRKRGIARAMLDRTAAEFRRQGHDTLTLWTHSGTGALAMYEHLGLRVRRSTTVYRLML